jgi:hypothetical protein
MDAESIEQLRAAESGTVTQKKKEMHDNEGSEDIARQENICRCPQRLCAVMKFGKAFRWR